jgi:hypothetical protein
MTYSRKSAEGGKSGEKLNGWIISNIEFSINLLETTKYIKDQLQRAESGKKFDIDILIWDNGQIFFRSNEIFENISTKR